jgi:hypothetical protein
MLRAGIIGGLWQGGGPFLLEALLPGPRLNQGAVHGPVVIRHQLMLAGLGQDWLEKSLRDVSGQPALPVLGKGRGFPDWVIHVQPDTPAKQHVVIQLLHQQTLTADRVEYLQQ